MITIDIAPEKSGLNGKLPQSRQVRPVSQFYKIIYPILNLFYYIIVINIVKCSKHVADSVDYTDEPEILINQIVKKVFPDGGESYATIESYNTATGRLLIKYDSDNEEEEITISQALKWIVGK